MDFEMSGSDDEYCGGQLEVLLSQLNESELDVVSKRIRMIKKQSKSSKNMGDSLNIPSTPTPTNQQEERPNKRPRVSPGSKSYSSAAKQGTSQSSTQGQSHSEPGIPIEIQNVPSDLITNPVALGKVIRTCFPEANIKSQRTKLDSIILYPADKASGDTMLNADLAPTPLQSCNIKEVATPIKKLGVLLTGVDPSITMPDISSELIRQNLDHLDIKRMFDRNSGQPTFKVKVVMKTLTEKERALKDGVYLGFTRHRALDFIEAPDVLVCYNCQEFGHLAKDCKKKVRCVRCGGPTNPQSVKCLRTTHNVFAVMVNTPQHTRAAQLIKLANGSYKSLEQSKPLIKWHKRPPPPPQATLNVGKIIDVVVEVVFTILKKYCPIQPQHHATLLSDLCKESSLALQNHMGLTKDAATLFNTLRNRLKPQPKPSEKTPDEQPPDSCPNHPQLM
jgi:hypothetical protein